jgi:hypothetical protein
MSPGERGVFTPCIGFDRGLTPSARRSVLYPFSAAAVRSATFFQLTTFHHALT